MSTKNSRINIKSIFALTIFLFFTSEFCAQINITIKDLETNKNLVGVSVLDSIGNMIISDKNGMVDISKYNYGSQFIISFTGYKTTSYILADEAQTVYLSPEYEMLNELTIVGDLNNRKLYEMAGSYVLNTNITMRQFNNESLVRSMNTLPGIRFEERSPSSYRVSIRGSLLRAPYGVRNVKVYWNQIPFTDPSGNSPLNLLDLNNINKIETIKGPSGSVFGAGIGGVLNIHSEPIKAAKFSGDVLYSQGSWKLNKLAVNLSTGNERMRLSAKYAKQKGQGYRDHSFSDRQVFQFDGVFFTSNKRTLKTNILYSDLFYETPGGLTKEQYDENPRQARPGASEKNASINHQNLLIGLVQNYTWSEKLKNSSAIYYAQGPKENPFTNNYELEKLQNYGGRTVFDIRSRIADLPIDFKTGIELNLGNSHANNYSNNNGDKGDLRYEDQVKQLQSFLFFQAELALSEKWKLILGSSLNYLKYDINRIQDIANDTTYHIYRTFNPEFIPRIGTFIKLTNQISAHGSISSGFSPPSVEEIRTSDGNLNTDLEAERAISYELGIRGNSKNSNLYYDFTTFWMEQNETIVSKSNENGTIIFENAGSTSQFGIEVLIGYAFIKNPNKNIQLLKIQSSYTYNNFRFKNYTKRNGNENIDYSGNKLTGTAPNISVTTIELNSKLGGFFNFSCNFTDEIPLNDANSVFGESYFLLTSKVGWNINFNESINLEVFFGIDNMLNEKYSLGNDLNAFGNRFFNAAPERNYYGGLHFFF